MTIRKIRPCYEVYAGHNAGKKFETDIQQLAEDVAKLLVKYHSDVPYYRARVAMVETTTKIEDGATLMETVSIRHIKRTWVATYEAGDVED